MFGVVVAIPSMTIELISCVSCPTQFEFNPQKDWIQQCYQCYKDTSTRRICTVCNKPNIVPTDKNNWQKICNSCYKESPLKPCYGCKELKLKAVEPWRRLCKECWETKRWDYLKICKVCDVTPIKANAEKWVETCTKCWLKNREKQWERCPQCNSKKLSKLKTAPACRPCMLLNGQIKLATREEDEKSLASTNIA